MWSRGKFFMVLFCVLSGIAFVTTKVLHYVVKKRMNLSNCEEGD